MWEKKMHYVYKKSTNKVKYMDNSLFDMIGVLGCNSKINKFDCLKLWSSHIYDILFILHVLKRKCRSCHDTLLKLYTVTV